MKKDDIEGPHIESDEYTLCSYLSYVGTTYIFKGELLITQVKNMEEALVTVKNLEHSDRFLDIINEKETD